MAEKYTVDKAMPTGEDHPKFGTEYVVKFNESEQSFKLWYQSEPQPGKVQWGTINGTKFKKERKPEDTSAPQSFSKKSTYKDNSDGQRQGMCVNNAANYVNAAALDSGQPVDAKTWAKMVHQYATALYRLGDLKQAEVEGEVAKDVDVASVFGATS